MASASLLFPAYLVSDRDGRVCLQAGIREYWVRQVQAKQKEISFRQAADATLVDATKRTATVTRPNTDRVPLRNGCASSTSFACVGR